MAPCKPPYSKHQETVSQQLQPVCTTENGQTQPGVPQNVQYVTPRVQPQAVHQYVRLDMSIGDTLKVLGCVQFAVGFACFCLNLFVLIIGLPGPLIVSPGIWGGVMFFVSGFLAIRTGERRSHGLIKASLVMSIVSAVSACVLLGLSAVFVRTTDYYSNDYELFLTVIALVPLSVVQITSSIMTSCFACWALCGVEERAVMSSQGDANTGLTSTQYAISPQPGTRITQQSAANMGYPQTNAYGPQAGVVHHGEHLSLGSTENGSVEQMVDVPHKEALIPQT